MKRTAWILVATAIILWVIVGRLRCRDDVVNTQRFATFNIENFPKDARQIEGAFDQIASLGATFVAVQEISEPALFEREAHRRLGASWEFVHLDTAPWTAPRVFGRSAGSKSHHNGIAFDTRAWTFVSMRSHGETRIGERHKPTLEVRLRPAAGGPIVRVLVVHLKSGGINDDIRERQLRGLAKILAKGFPGEPTILLGDFNATGERDRENLAALATGGHVEWATKDLACSAFWSREHACPRSRLDHVFTTQHALRVEAAGACATHGCEASDSCPVWAEHVSDHCPVVVTIQAAQ